jgi:hypothetical protein
MNLIVSETPKPLETAYAGCRFRSRLEARWAVFFDALGLRWEYEPDAYALPSGNYLPDFRLHLASGPVWFEVKASNAPDGDPRWHELAMLTDTKVCIAFGMPRLAGKDTDFCEHIEVQFDGGGVDHGYQFCVCQCRKIGLEFDGRSARICGEDCYPDEDKMYSGHDPRILAAYQKALSTRFEPRALRAEAIAVTDVEKLTVIAGACVTEARTAEQRGELVYAWATLVKHHPQSTPAQQALASAIMDSAVPLSSGTVTP